MVWRRGPTGDATCDTLVLHVSRRLTAFYTGRRIVGRRENPNAGGVVFVDATCSSSRPPHHREATERERVLTPFNAADGALARHGRILFLELRWRVDLTAVRYS